MPQNEELTQNTESAGATKKEIRKDDDIVDEVREPVIEHLKTKPVPAVITLFAGSVVAVDTYFQGYPLKNALMIILICLVIFFLAGELAKLLLDRVEIIVPEEPAEEAADGEAGETDAAGKNESGKTDNEDRE